MKTIKIALTGGPRAGKTEILGELKKYISKVNDVKLFCLPETATEISKNLVKPCDVDLAINFQKSVFNRQLFKETEVNEVINYYNSNKNVIMCDRGIFDNKAYLNNQAEFDYLLDYYGKDELDLLDSYDLILYLVSSSTIDEIEYEKNSNPERYEDKDAASKLDIKTKNAWVGHRNIKVVKPRLNFQDKIDETKLYFDDAINLTRKNNFISYEISPFSSDLSVYNEENSKKILVEELYLNNNSNGTLDLIILKRTYKNFTTYFLYNKGVGVNSRYIFNEERISYESYLELIKKHGIKKEVIREELCFFSDYDQCKILDFGSLKFLEIAPNASIPENMEIKGKIKSLKI